jgi:hypothetical protein
MGWSSLISAWRDHAEELGVYSAYPERQSCDSEEGLPPGIRKTYLSPARALGSSGLAGTQLERVR